MGSDILKTRGGVGVIRIEEENACQCLNIAINSSIWSVAYDFISKRP